MFTSKTILFDVDGVLLDTMSVWEHSADGYLMDVWGEKAPADIDKKCATMSLMEFGEYAKMLYPNIPLEPAGFAKGVAEYIKQKYVNAKAMPGMVETVKVLAKAGYTLYLATASDEENVEGALTNLGVWNCFSGIYTCTKIGHSKKYTQYYEEISKIINVPCDELIMIEDSLHSAITAKKAGVSVVGVYESYSEESKEEMKAVCDVYLNSLDELINYLDV